jgi:uncharacterized protein YdeI (YjbR/CyaY-like superfamily)
MVNDATPALEVRAAGQLRQWLALHHAQDESVWLITWRKRSGAPCLSRSDVLDELLCFGWIDGARCKVDDARTSQLISPRRHQLWTSTYRARAARLIKSR